MGYHRVEEGPWPRGTTVAVWAASSVVGGIPVGSPLDSDVAVEDGGVVFGGLTEGADYVAFGSGGSKSFTATDVETRVSALNLRAFNVKSSEYGATGDGTTDDTGAIQAAINAAEAYVAGASWMRSAVVELPPGPYQLSAPLTVKVDNVSMHGATPGNPKGAADPANPVYGGTVLRPTAAFAGPWVVKAGRVAADRALSGVFLRELAIDGVAVTTLVNGYVTAGSVGGVLFQVFNGGLDNTYVARVGGDGYFMQAIDNDTTFPKGAFDNRLFRAKADAVGGAGFHTTVGATDNIYLGCIFEYCSSHGMYLEGSGQQLSGCDIYNCLGNAIFGTARAQEIVGNRMIDCNGGVYLASNEGGDFVIVGNTLRSLSYGGDNTYDGVNIAPTGTIRGGTIVGNAFSTLQRNGPANRMRYCVNLVNGNIVGCMVGLNSVGYIAPATGPFGTAFLNNNGSNTVNFGLGQTSSQTLVEELLGNGVRRLTGTGSPEGAKTAPVGSMYLRSDGGATSTLYIKESGTGNTGWIAK